MTLIVMFGQRKWNWPRSIGPRGSKSPFHCSRTGPYCVENVALCSSTYASTETSTTFEKAGWAIWQW